MFKCAGCKAKDEEIAWLRSELQTERRLRGEILVPGVMKRVESPPTENEPAKAATPPPKKPQPTFPGYEPMPPEPEVQVE